MPRVVGKIGRKGGVELRDMEFLRRNTDRAAKIALPGPFTMSQQAKDEFDNDDEALAMALAEAVNAEALRIAERRRRRDPARRPWVRDDPDRRQTLRREGDQPRPAGHYGADGGSSCFGYAASSRAINQAFGQFVPGRTRRHQRRADLDRGGAAELDLGVLADFSSKKIMLA